MDKLISGQACNLVFEYEGVVEILRPQVKFTIYNRSGIALTHFDSDLSIKVIPNLPHNGNVKFHFERLPLSEGEYFINLVIVGSGTILDYVQNAFFFSILPGPFFDSGRNSSAIKDICLFKDNWLV